MKCPACGADFNGNFCSNCGLKRNEPAKRCPRCGTEYVGKFCSNCGFSDSEPLQRQANPRKELSTSQKIVCILAVPLMLLIFFILLEVLSWPSSQQGEVRPRQPSSSLAASTTPTPVPTINAISISSADLLATYDANEVNADDLYNGKTLSVTGTINSIGKGIVDEVYITLGTGSSYELYSVQCYFTDEGEIDTVGTLEKGQTVTVIGKCDGKVFNVQLKGCSIGEVFTNYSS